jgi:hypothetical protein
MTPSYACDNGAEHNIFPFFRQNDGSIMRQVTLQGAAIAGVAAHRSADAGSLANAEQHTTACRGLCIAFVASIEVYDTSKQPVFQAALLGLDIS